MERAGPRYVLAVDRSSARLRRDITNGGGLVLTDDAEPLLAAFAELVDAMGAARAVQRVVADGTERPARLALVVGDVGGAPDGSYEGRAVADARALVRLADSGHLLLSDDVAGALGPLLPVGARARDVVLSDLVGVVHVHDAGPPGGAELPTSALLRPALPAPLAAADAGTVVGRDPERAALLRAWQLAANGERTVAVVHGESGVGKTRLVADLAATVHAEGGLVLYGHCEEEERVPHRPFVEALRFYFERVDVPTAAAVLGASAAELTRLVPELVPHLGAPYRSDEGAGADEHQLHAAIDQWLALGGVGAGTLLILDDVQWAPAPTLALIDHVVRSTRAARLLVVLLQRANAPDLPDQVHVVGLEALGRDAVATLVSERLGRPGRAIVDDVVAATGGHPLYVVHLLEHLSELDLIELRGVTELLGETGVPPTLREILDQRLARVDDAHLDVLSRAAVLGHRFEPSVLERIVVDPTIVPAALQSGADLRLLEPDGDGWRFSHALVRAALGERLGPTRRGRLHVIAAEAIEDLYGDDLDAHVSELADHLVRAGARHPRTVELAAAAGEQALHRMAPADAARWFGAALDALGDEIDEARRGELLVAQGIARHRSGHADGLSQVVAAGHAAAARGDDALLVRAALGCSRGFFSHLASVDPDRVALLELALARHTTPDAARARLLAHLALELRWADRADTSPELSAASLALARELGQPDVLVDALAAHQGTMHDPSLSVARVALAEELVQLADAIGDPGERVRARWFLADALHERGQVAAQAVVIDEMTALAERSGQPSVVWPTLLFEVARVATEGALDRAEEIATRAHSLGLRNGHSDATLFFGGQLYALRLEQDRLAELAPLFEPFADAPEAHPVIGAMQSPIDVETGRASAARTRLDRLANGTLASLRRDDLRLPTLAYVVLVAHALGVKEAAAEVDAVLEPITEGFVFSQGGAIGATGAITYFRGLNQSTLGDRDAAVRLLEEAVERHEATGVVAWTNRSRLALAEELLEVDRPRAIALATRAAADLHGTAFTALRRRAARILAS